LARGNLLRGGGLRTQAEANNKHSGQRETPAARNASMGHGKSFAMSAVGSRLSAVPRKLRLLSFDFRISSFGYLRATNL
jgi:hypothetical protein